MRRNSILFLLSFTLLTASTVLVVFVLNGVVVPHLMKQAHVGSVCQIADIRHVRCEVNNMERGDHSVHSEAYMKDSSSSSVDNSNLKEDDSMVNLKDKSNRKGGNSRNSEAFMNYSNVAERFEDTRNTSKRHVPTHPTKEDYNTENVNKESSEAYMKDNSIGQATENGEDTRNTIKRHVSKTPISEEYNAKGIRDENINGNVRNELSNVNGKLTEGYGDNANSENTEYKSKTLKNESKTLERIPNMTHNQTNSNTESSKTAPIIEEFPENGDVLMNITKSVYPHPFQHGERLDEESVKHADDQALNNLTTSITGTAILQSHKSNLRHPDILKFSTPRFNVDIKTYKSSSTSTSNSTSSDDTVYWTKQTDSCTPCVQVTVFYVDMSGNTQYGFLINRHTDQDNSSLRSRCFCRDCEITTMSSSSTGSANIPALQYRDRRLLLGQTTYCLFDTAERYAAVSSLGIHDGSGETLQAILWPSLLFVVGFVATVISLIHLCKDWDMDFSDSSFCLYVTGVVDIL